MASLGDWISLIVISSLFFGTIAAFVYVTESAKKTAADKDKELRAKGVTVKASGVDIKLNKQAPTREEIVESQQRAFMKGGEALMRPGVMSAGQRASFRAQQDDSAPSAFVADPDDVDDQKRPKSAKRNPDKAAAKAANKQEKAAAKAAEKQTVPPP